jgi:hypothetical protein
MEKTYKKAKRAIILTFLSILISFCLILYFKITQNNLRFLLYVLIYFLIINIRIYVSKLLYDLNCNYNPSNSYLKKLIKTAGTRPDCDGIKYVDGLIIKQQWKFILTISSILFFDLYTLYNER